MRPGLIKQDVVLVDTEPQVANDLPDEWPHDDLGAVIGNDDSSSVPVLEHIVTTVGSDASKSGSFGYTA